MISKVSEKIYKLVKMSLKRDFSGRMEEKVQSKKVEFMKKTCVFRLK